MGPNASWPYIFKLSPVIPIYQAVSEHVENVFGTQKSSRHSDPDSGIDITQLLRSYQSNMIYVFDAARSHVLKKDELVDPLVEGQKALMESKYFKDWADFRSIFVNHRSLEQTFDGPPSDQPLPPTPSAPSSPTIKVEHPDNPPAAKRLRLSGRTLEDLILEYDGLVEDGEINAALDAGVGAFFGME